MSSKVSANDQAPCADILGAGWKDFIKREHTDNNYLAFLAGKYHKKSMCGFAYRLRLMLTVHAIFFPFLIPYKESRLWNLVQCVDEKTTNSPIRLSGLVSVQEQRFFTICKHFGLASVRNSSNIQLFLQSNEFFRAKKNTTEGRGFLCVIKLKGGNLVKNLGHFVKVTILLGFFSFICKSNILLIVNIQILKFCIPIQKF